MNRNLTIVYPVHISDYWTDRLITNRAQWVSATRYVLETTFIHYSFSPSLFTCGNMANDWAPNGKWRRGFSSLTLNSFSTLSGEKCILKCNPVLVFYTFLFVLNSENFDAELWKFETVDGKIVGKLFFASSSNFYRLFFSKLTVKNNSFGNGVLFDSPGNWLIAVRIRFSCRKSIFQWFF